MKYLFFIVFSFSISVAFAEKLIVSRTNHKGHTLVDVLEKNKKDYSISGFSLNKKMVSNGKNTQTKNLWEQTFKTVQKMNSRKIASQCSAGQYKIIFEDEKRKSRVYRGCYDDLLYRQVIFNIKNLRKDAQSIQ